MAIHIALLRGINLGAAHRVPMADLRALLTEAGYDGVRTYVQSGNVVLGSTARAPAVQSDLSERISGRFGFDVPVIVRSRAQLATVVAEDPFGDEATEPKRYQVTFLDESLSAETADRLEQVRSGSERVVVRGRHVYSWHPDGMARSKLGTALAGKRLGTAATARNWTTVNTLLRMAGE